MWNKDQDDFIRHHETGARKLSVFEAIHAMDSDDESTNSDDASYSDAKESKTSAFDEESVLNTTVESSQEGTVDIAQKLD